MPSNHPLLERIAILLLAALPGSALAQAIDVCGCAGSTQSLGAFNSNDPNTFPPGTVLNPSTNPDEITIPLPPDGVLVFDSFTVANASSNSSEARVVFARNAANTPVTLLVRGDVLVSGGDILSVNGFPGSSGTGTTAGIGGAGGPGGFAGGDGAFQFVNQAASGGTGVGPGGGAGSTTTTAAGGGIFVGVPELRPLRGGSGGGGGSSRSSTGACSGGGGGGGAGAIVIAANGTITVSGTIQANGAASGNAASGTGCDTAGGGGSAGAIRLLATTITGGGRIEALGGNGSGCCGYAGLDGGSGTIRMESIFNSFGTNVVPAAARFPSPQPLVNPVNPTVRIARVQGADTPANPIGHLGQIDMIVAAPGQVQLDLATQDVPAGTDLLVTVKPKIGAAPVSQRITLDAADCAAGACAVDATFDLIPGVYIAEARATFEVP